jgi:hypothetical protein
MKTFICYKIITYSNYSKLLLLIEISTFKEIMIRISSFNSYIHLKMINLCMFEQKTCKIKVFFENNLLFITLIA